MSALAEPPRARRPVGKSAAPPWGPRRPGGRSFARWQRAVRLGWRSLGLHRLRSLLTILGIVFGVCSVIAMLAIGEGASHEAQEQIKNLGSRNIILRSVKPPDSRRPSEQGENDRITQYGLTYADVRRLELTIPGIRLVVPGRLMHETVWNISRFIDADILGTQPSFPTVRNQRLAGGRFFTDAEMDGRASVCVLGAEVAAKLFPVTTALGGHVRVRSEYYRVVGVLEARTKAVKTAEGVASGADTTGLRLFIPLTTALTRYGQILVRESAGSYGAERVELHEVTVSVSDPDQVVEISRAVRNVLDRNHPKQDVEVVVPLELLKRAERTKQIFNVVLGSIAAISLLVGGIGIMNIMLASVTERTREIGVRRALGARRHDIVAQFLVETVMLSAAGGVLGVLLGLAIPWLVTMFAGMKTIVTFWSPPLAFTISALVGVVFGMYPAFRAARMDPVEALRHE